MGTTVEEGSLRDWLGEVEQYERILVASDFDGTLAPIVLDPDEAFPLSESMAALERLGNLPGVAVALVSGRQIDDLMRRAPLPRASYAGNHGLEIIRPGLPRWRLEEAVAASVAIKACMRGLQVQLRHVPGIRFEPKGMTASVHLRGVPDALHGEVTQHVLSMVHATRPEITLKLGRLVLELAPCIAWNKADAVKQICETDFGGETPERIIYLGDDLTDEDVFIEYPEEWTIRVDAQGEISALTRARAVVPGPRAVAAFLTELADRLELGRSQ